MASRTQKSIINISVTLGMYFINLVLQFFSRKIFLDYLGEELVGLNTTAMSLLQFLNMAELGIGSAIGATLYKPLLERQHVTISEIVTLHGMLYRRIAWLIVGASAVVMCAFPWIFDDMTLPMWYAYASYGVLLYSSLLMYFANYHTVLLSADQQEYKIMCTYRLSVILKVVAQTLCIWFLPYGYLWWLVCEVVFSTLGAVALRIVVRRTYPFLVRSARTFRELSRTYPQVITKIKQLFFHKIAGVAATQLSPIIVNAFTTLSMVALYGNYLMVFSGFVQLMLSMFMGVNSGIGNLIAEGNREAVLRFFKEFFSLRFMLNATLCFLFLTEGQNFIVVWLGSQYLLPWTSLLIIAMTLFVTVLRQTLDNYIYAFGMFRDIWAPITELILNIGLSVGFGALWGLNGILLGVFISIALIGGVWKPYFLFSQGLGASLGIYWSLFGRCMLSAVVAGAVAFGIGAAAAIDGTTIAGFITSTAVNGLSFLAVLVAMMLLTRTGIGAFIDRLSNIAHKILKKS